MSTIRYKLILLAVVVGLAGMQAIPLNAQDHSGISDDAPRVAKSADSDASGAGKHGDAHGSEGKGHESSSGWNTVWKPAVTQLIGFLLLVFLYVQWVHPFLKRMHKERVDRIESDYEQIEREKEDLKEREQEIEKKMANIEQRAKEEREEILERGRRLREETIEEAERQAEEALENARDEAERIRKRAVVELQNSLSESALQGVRKFFREAADEDLHEQFQGQLLTALENADSLDVFQRGDGDVQIQDESS